LGRQLGKANKNNSMATPPQRPSDYQPTYNEGCDLINNAGKEQRSIAYNKHQETKKAIWHIVEWSLTNPETREQAVARFRHLCQQIITSVYGYHDTAPFALQILDTVEKYNKCSVKQAKLVALPIADRAVSNAETVVGKELYQAYQKQQAPQS